MIALPPQKIASFVKTHFKYKTRKGDTEYIICNPLNGDTGFHFGINIVTGLCHDWRSDNWVGYNARTGKRHNCTFLKFVQVWLNCSYIDAIKAIVGQNVDPKTILQQADRQGPTQYAEVIIALPDGARRITGSEGRLATLVQNWLSNKRGLGPEVIKKYDLHFFGMEVFWPYYEYGDLVYWQSRSCVDKVFNFPPAATGVTKGQFLYGFDFIEPASYMVITEAIIDCNTIEDQCAASGGASLTARQIDKIKLLGPKDGVILAPDNDAAGVDSIIHNAELLEAQRFRVMYSIPPSLEYTDQSGKKRYTKDWNDIRVNAQADPKAALEENIKNLTLTEKIRLRKLAQWLKANPRP